MSDHDSLASKEGSLSALAKGAARGEACWPAFGRYKPGTSKKSRIGGKQLGAGVLCFPIWQVFIYDVYWILLVCRHVLEFKANRNKNNQTSPQKNQTNKNTILDLKTTNKKNYCPLPPVQPCLALAA